MKENALSQPSVSVTGGLVAVLEGLHFDDVGGVCPAVDSPARCGPHAQTLNPKQDRCQLSCRQGVVGAATGAGIIIGTYFAFYSTTKRFLRERTDMSEGETVTGSLP